jgi:hypothetical protein
MLGNPFQLNGWELAGASEQNKSGSPVGIANKDMDAIVQLCYPVADGWLWCNAVKRWGPLRENPNGKGYVFPCRNAKKTKPRLIAEAKS